MSNSNYIQDVAALIKISEFLSVCAEKESLDKTKAYKAARLRFAVDNRIVDLVADDKFMAFVDEIKDQQTMAQAEASLKELIKQHDESSKEWLKDSIEKHQAPDEVNKQETKEVETQMVAEPVVKKPKSPGFKKVK